MSVLQPMVGEPLAIDLINTRAVTPTGPIDFLTTSDDLREWLDRQRGRLGTLAPDGGKTLPRTALPAVRDVRRHAAAAVESARFGQRPPPESLRGLNEAARAAPAAQSLEWDGSSVVLRSHRRAGAGHGLAALLADSAGSLLTGPAITKVRQCEAPHCIWLFLPTNPRRRWCSPSICGNRTRVARYYQRHRSTERE